MGLKILFYLAAAFFCLACRADTEVQFSGLKIPRENVLYYSEKDTSVFDNGVNSIALLIAESEIGSALPSYQIPIRGSQQLSLTLHAGETNVERPHSAILAELGTNIIRIERDKYLGYERHYQAEKRWILVSNHDGQGQSFVALCRVATVLQEERDSCLFSTNIHGFRVSFLLIDGNISLFSELENFLYQKFDGWSIEATK